MGRHSGFPRPGDRIRLAVPLTTGGVAQERFGTVLERSCGRSNALRVRWESAVGPAPDAGLESWLADAGWYWDKAQLDVVGRNDTRPGPSPTAPLPRPTATAGDAWLTSGPTDPGAGGGSDGSLEAVAEWEAALAAEANTDADAGWQQMMAAALGLEAPPTGPPVGRRTGPAAQPAGRPSPAPRPPAEPPRAGTPVAPASTRTPMTRDEYGVRPAPPAPPAPAPGRASHDILPKASQKKRRGRR